MGMQVVEKRQWISENQFSQLLAICQFLPGPASSQLGFCLGLLRGGWLGGLAAFLMFTLPSVILLVVFASFLPMLEGKAGQAIIHGLKIVALAVVTHGVLGMLSKLCPDRPRKTIAGLTAAFLVIMSAAWGQLLVVAAGGLAGLVLCRQVKPSDDCHLPVRHSVTSAWVLVSLFSILLVSGFFLGRAESILTVSHAYYRAGALVFGGGHVVLPLLEEFVVAPGWVTQDEFLAGYGAAQAVPGPMFSFASYLGMVQGGLGYALIAVGSIFLPGFLLVSGILPLWSRIAKGRRAARAIAGVNAAVVGLLGAALYDPIFTSAVNNAGDLAIGIVACVMLRAWNLSALWVVGWCVLASVASVFVF